MNEHDEVCPHCGYCKHCGRANQAAPIVIPGYPVPSWPMWPRPVVPPWYSPFTYTVTTTSNTDGSINVGGDPNVRLMH
jgi:hypothetical protein